MCTTHWHSGRVTIVTLGFYQIVNCFEMSDHNGSAFSEDCDPVRVSYSCFTPEFFPRSDSTEAKLSDFKFAPREISLLSFHI